MGVDWRRYGLRGERSARRLVRFVREPDVLLIVTVPSEEAVRRKPELTAAEVERQYAEWQRLPLRRSRRVTLDNTGPLEETVDGALRLVDAMTP
jgi:thymidylate kinase